MISTSHVAIKIRCKFCRQFRLPSHIVRNYTAEGALCENCLEWHDKALRLLSTGEPPPGCQVCGVTFESLGQAWGAEVKMFVHPKDGIYQILCTGCSDSYARKSYMYDETAWGHRHKVRGRK